MTVRLFIEPDAWDEATVWADLGASEPAALLTRHDIADSGEGGDALWSIITENVPEVLS